MGEFVTMQTEDGVGIVRLNRPPVNALNRQLVSELGECLGETTSERGVRALLLWGGEKVFAAGADIKEMTGHDEASMHDYIGVFHEVFAAFERVPVVTVAAIAGYALGGGLELALCCDFRVCAASAKLGQPEILLGVIPGAGGTQRLPRLIGTGRAKDLVYSGRTLGTDEALGIGLVTTVVPDEELYRRAVGLARRYAAGPSVALAAAKRVIGEGMEAPLEEGLEAERRAFASLFSTEDQAIGMASFAEKGPGKADFVGR